MLCYQLPHSMICHSRFLNDASIHSQILSVVYLKKGIDERETIPTEILQVPCLSE